MKCFRSFAEGFWSRADFLHEIRWKEGHPICKISLINFTLKSKLNRSSRPEMFVNFIKKDTPKQVFSCTFCEIFKKAFFLYNTCVSCFWLKANVLHPLEGKNRAHKMNTHTYSNITISFNQREPILKKNLHI